MEKAYSSEPQGYLFRCCGAAVDGEATAAIAGRVVYECVRKKYRLAFSHNMHLESELSASPCLSHQNRWASLSGIRDFSSGQRKAGFETWKGRGTWSCANKQGRVNF